MNSEPITNKYEFLIGLKKSLVRTLLAVIPLIATSLLNIIPLGIREMTIGSIVLLLINMLHNYLKIKYKDYIQI